MNLDQFTEKIHEVLTERKENYGEASAMFENIAVIWSVLLGVKITPRQVALCMVALKLLRENHTHNDDNIVDLASYGYFAGGLK